MSDQARRLGSSGVFKAIVMSARRLSRVLSDADAELSPEAEDFGTQVAQAFIAGRFADVHALGTELFQQRSARAAFEENWRNAVRERGTLTGYEISNAGAIELQYIPGLEEVPQAQFVAFLELVFSSPTVPLDHEKAFAVGAVLLRENGAIRIGALHAR